MTYVSPIDEASPYPGHHVAVQIPAAELESFSHSFPRSWPEGVHAITGVRKGLNPDDARPREIHAVIFDAKVWKSGRAKKWLGDNAFKSDSFEEGSDGEPAPPADIDYYTPDYDGYGYRWWVNEARVNAGAKEEMVASMALYRTELANLVRNVRTRWSAAGRSSPGATRTRTARASAP
jgi:hypothetical protein